MTRPVLGAAITRRALIVGGLAAVCVRSARAASGVVLVLIGADVPSGPACAEAFSAALPDATVMSYTLDPVEGAGAEVADGLRGLPLAAVFALGDVAVRVAVREYPTVPLVYAEAPAASEQVSGRADALGVRAAYDPAPAIARMQALMPSARTVGLMRFSPRSDDAFVAAALAAAGKWKITVVDVLDEAGVQSALGVALTHDVVWLAPGAWPSASVGQVLTQARAQARPVVGARLAHVEAAQPACLALFPDPIQAGSVAAGIVARLLDGAAPVEPAPAAPRVYGHQAACRAAGVLLNKTTSAAVDVWVDRKN